MADKKISQLEKLKNIDGTELIPIAKNGENYSINPKQITESVERTVGSVQTELGTKADATDVAALKKLIPTQASQNNQLADKDFVNSSISTNTAEFKGTFNSLGELQKQSADANDYGFVVSTDLDGNTVYNKYKYVEGEGWKFEYALNNSSFTALQWAAINSNITADLVAKLSALPNASDILTGKQAAAKYFPLTDGQDLEHLVETLNEGLGHVEEDMKGLATKTEVTEATKDMATQYWVDGKGYLTEHQDISGLATKKEVEDFEKEVEETYAKQEGSYPDLVAGNAANLQGNNEIVSSSAYHPTGGNEDVLFGTAQIENIKGNAMAWNQLIYNGNFANGRKGWKNGNKVSSVVNDGVLEITISDSEYGTNRYVLINAPYYPNGIKDHKYIAKCETKATNNSDTSVNCIGIIVEVSQIYAKEHNYTTSWKTVYTDIFSMTDTADVILRLYHLLDETETIYYRNVCLFDLTLIYGAGNEPTTAEQFEADYQRWFGKTLEYEEYDEGSIRPVLATGIKTVGFNLTKINEFEGSAAEWNRIKDDHILWSNDCGYTGQIYINSDFVRKSGEGRIFAQIIYADGDYAYVYFPDSTGITKAPFITPKGKVVRYIKTSYDTDWNGILSNICISMVWSGKRNGDYEPYWEETQPLPITELTSNGVKIFPDGLKRAGDVYDEIFIENGVTKAVKRVGVLTNLDTLEWTYSEGTNTVNGKRYRSILQGNYPLTNGTYTKNALHSYYSNESKYIGENTRDKVFAIHAEKNHLYLKDLSLDDDVEGLKSRLSGTVLYYELAEPETYIIDNFNLPVVYKIDDFGTEQILMPENSIAPTITSRYGINAVDAIRNLSRNYVNKNGDTVTGTLNLTNDNPLNVSSTNVIKNLNADMVDGKHDGEFTAINHKATEIKESDANNYLSLSLAGTMVYKAGGTHVDNLPKTVGDDNGCLLSNFRVSASIGQLCMQTSANAPLWFRVGSPSSTGTWRRIAYVTDTVEAANRLICTQTTTTDINKVPTISQMCVVNISTSGTFGLASAMTAGTELQVFINNTGSDSITITIPDTFKHNGTTSIDIPAGNYGEINVISDGTNLYLRANGGG